MNRMQKHNLYNIKRNFEKKTGTRLISGGVAPHAAYEEHPVSRKRMPRVALIAAIVTVFFTLTAFAVSIFSPLAGDALTLTGTYKGNGIVTVVVENHSNKTLEFEPQAKLFKWITGEEIERQAGDIVFKGTTIEPKSTAIMTLDLSGAYDMAFLEDSKFTEHYYLLLTNQYFIYGQQWKCSIYFGEQPIEKPENVGLYTAMPEDILSRVDECLRFYYEDDFTGLFAGNPHHFDYLQKAQEWILRSGKNIVPVSTEYLNVCTPPDSVIFDETYPLDYQYRLTYNGMALEDVFGNIVGATESERILYVRTSLPEKKGETNAVRPLPLLYYASYDKAAITSEEDCVFIHGQLVSFAELAPYLVYENDVVKTFDVTHLFYTDLREYVNDAMEYWDATGYDYYFDEQVYTRIENVYNYYKESIQFQTYEELVDSGSFFDYVGEHVGHEEVATTGLYGVLKSDVGIKHVTICIYDENGTEFSKTYELSNSYTFDLANATEINQYIFSLESGEYTVEVFAKLDTDVKSMRHYHHMVFIVE